MLISKDVSCPFLQRIFRISFKKDCVLFMNHQKKKCGKGEKKVSERNCEEMIKKKRKEKQEKV